MLLVCASLALGACNKLSNGDVITQTRNIDHPFQIIEMRDNVDVTLRHSNAENAAGTIIITTGENLIDNINTEIEEVKLHVTHNGINDSVVFNKLVIKNDNGWNFIRPYDYQLEATIYYDTLFELIFNSNANIVTDTLRGYNFWTDFTSYEDSVQITTDSLISNLHINIVGGSGKFKVLANCYRLMTQYEHGTSDISLYGQAVRAETNAGYDCHGIIDGFDMEASSYHTVNNHGTNKIYGRAFNSFIARNDNIGHVYYVRYQKPGKIIHWGHFEDGHWVENDTVDTTYTPPLSVIRRGVYSDSISSIHERP